MGADPVVGKLAIIFRGLFALAARGGDRAANREGRGYTRNTVFRHTTPSENDERRVSLRLRDVKFSWNQ